MGWLIGALILGGIYWWHRSAEAAGETVSPLGPPNWQPTPTPPQTPSAPPGVVPTSIDSAGATLVVLQPGNMGTLKLVSMSSTAIGVRTPALDIQTPSGGTLVDITSSNAQVMSGAFPGMIGAGTAGVALGSANLPGTTKLTVTWRDSAGSAQTTTFTVVAS